LKRNLRASVDALVAAVAAGPKSPDARRSPNTSERPALVPWTSRKSPPTGGLTAPPAGFKSEIVKTVEFEAMTISPTTQELLKAAAGRGVSNDPTLLTRSKVRLLQNTSKMPKHGRGAPGVYLLPDEAQTCVKTLRVILGVLYSVFVERGPDDKFVAEHHALPPAAEKDEYRWRLRGNVIEKEARLAGVFNGLDAEFDLAKTGMKVARAINSDAKARLRKLSLPLYGLAYEFGSHEVVNDRGQSYFGPTFTFLGAVSDPDGPSEEEIIRASALCDVVEATLEEAKRESAQMVADRKRIEIIASGKGAVALPQQLTPIDDDIPF
jgi:hypothetical protein